MIAGEKGVRGAATVSVLVVLCFNVVGCTHWGSPGQQVVPRLACDGWVAKGLGDEAAWDFVGDSVAIAAGSPDLGRSGEVGSIYDGLRFAKFGLAIKDGSEVEVSVQSENTERILVEWGPTEPDVPGSALRFEDCGASQEWLIFAGGAWIPGPGCYEFAVRTGDRRDSMKLGVGATC